MMNEIMSHKQANFLQVRLKKVTSRRCITRGYGLCMRSRTGSGVATWSARRRHPGGQASWVVAVCLERAPFLLLAVEPSAL